MEDLRRLLEEYQKTSDKIEKILERSEEYRSMTKTMELKLDLLKDEWQKIYKVIYGDGNIDPITTRIKVLETKIMEMDESIENVQNNHIKALEAERSKMQKIVVAIIGGFFTLISSLFAWFIDFKK